MNNIEKLVNRTIDLMIEKNVSIKEMCQKTGITQSTISYIINKVSIPRLETLILMLDVLGAELVIKEKGN